MRSAVAFGILVACLIVAGPANAAKPTAPAQVDLGAACADGVAGLRVRDAAFKRKPNDKFKPRQFVDVGQCLLDERNERVPAALFALGPAPLPLTVRVELYGSREGTFAAAVALLDAEFRPLRKFDFEQFTKRSLDYSLTIFVNQEMSDARYVLITPDPAAVGRTSKLVSGRRWTAPIITPTVVGAYSDGVESVVEEPLEAAGSLQVIVEPYAARELGK